MEKYLSKITLYITLLILSFALIAATEKFTVTVECNQSTTVELQDANIQKAIDGGLVLRDGDISGMSYDEESNLLEIYYVGGRSNILHLNSLSFEPQVFGVKCLGKHIYVQFYSPALYESYGQTSQGIIILSNYNPLDMRNDPYNDIASEYPVVTQPTTADLSFVMVHYYLEKHNNVERGLSLCAADTADGLLMGVASSSCYIVCQGNAEVMAQYLPTTTRVVSMWSRRQDLENGYIALWSELHSTVELFDNNEWYVADPTYGFAYVKDTIGHRLTAQELIEALEEQNVSDLTFGLVHNGLIHDVPGEFFVEANTTLAGIYYTPDKRLEYRMIKEEQLIP